MTNTQLKFCGVCKFTFLLDFDRPNRYMAKRNGKDIWVCPECRKMLVGES